MTFEVNNATVNNKKFLNFEITVVVRLMMIR